MEAWIPVVSGSNPSYPFVLTVCLSLRVFRGYPFCQRLHFQLSRSGKQEGSASALTVAPKEPYEHNSALKMKAKRGCTTGWVTVWGRV